MKLVEVLSCLPAGFVILEQSFRKPDYSGSYRITLHGKCTYSADYITALFPAWIRALLRIRNMLVKPFGLKGDLVKILSLPAKEITYTVGEQAIFFLLRRKPKRK